MDPNLWTLKTDVDPKNYRHPIVYWSFDNGTVMLINGDHFPITRWIDEDGNDADDVEDTVVVVAGPDKNGEYWNWAVSDFGWVPIQ